MNSTLALALGFCHILFEMSLELAHFCNKSYLRIVVILMINACDKVLTNCLTKPKRNCKIQKINKTKRNILASMKKEWLIILPLNLV